MLRFLLPLLLIAPLARAAPEPYRLDAVRSTVGFSYSLGGEEKTGRMPVTSAALMVDLDSLPASRISVVLDPAHARAGFFLATEAVRGPGMLDAARFPEIRFRSTAITGTLQNATVTGDLTLRGITRKVTLRAGLYRQRGTDALDRDNLTILLTGTISRAAFGATGHPDLIGDRIGLNIIARITK